MGSGHSQVDYGRYAADFYETALQNTCLLPDIGIDETLQKYSGTDSNAALQAYSNNLLSSTPGFVNSLGSSLRALSPVPNAVGLGAFVISMIMEICIKSTQTDVRNFEMLRRVFGEEKASSVRDTMSEYLMRHQLFIYDDQRLKEELRRLEQQLNSHLVKLRNSLLHDGQMSTRGFKIWVNGASFHLQMLIHEARLNVQTGKPASGYIDPINAAITVYSQDLERLLEKYKTCKDGVRFISWTLCPYTCHTSCLIESARCVKSHKLSNQLIPCKGPEVTEAFMRHFVTHYEPTLGLRSHFTDIKSNLNFLISQHPSFTLPTDTA